MKVSLITTVKNEEENIKEFLNSIIKQTKKPDEFIIVDGGSTDRTFRILKQYSKKYRWIKVYQFRNINIARGRNYAIKKAKNKIIAVTDAGCKIDKRWLEYITKPLIKNKADFVAGNYKALSKNNFEYFQGLLVVKSGSKLMPSRASSRSIAFKKQIWTKIKGYPEKFLTGEDTQFNIKVFSKFKVVYEKKAIVYWRMRPNIRAFFKQFFLYGKGSKIQGNIIKIKRDLMALIFVWLYFLAFITCLFIKPIISLILAILVFLYLILYSFKIFIKSKNLLAFVYVPLLESIRRKAFVLGATFG